jgi:hypothetical protein
VRPSGGRAIAGRVRAQLEHSLAVLALVLSSCAAPSAPVSRRDVGRYLHELDAWAPQEAEVGRAVTRILATEFADEAEVRRQIAESLPRVEQQLARMRGYDPSGPELRAIHASYVEAWATLQRGYADITSGFDSRDQELLGRGRRALLAWRRALPATARRLRALTAATSEQGPPT